MFNRKKIEKLEAEKEKLKQEIGHLQREKEILEEGNAALREKLDAIKESIYTTPKNCKLGRYCQACEFSRAFVIHHGFLAETIYVCRRDEICQNFVAKEDVKIKEVHNNDKT
jgi:hypothetical protein